MGERSKEQILIKTAAPLLTAWFMKNKRFMPWREDPTPYHVWVSEIMLQQTRVDTVMPYYERFVTALPDVQALADCEEDRLLKFWEGLGYYSRVRNMQKAARKIVDENNGQMPENFEELRALPGIGDYTAGAIASIALHQPKPVVDGNVLRVISRLLGAYDDIGQQRTKQIYADDLKAFLSEYSGDPSVFNQGLMELGALVCVPNGAPKCEDCPWNGICTAYLCGSTDEIPVKQAKKARKIEEKTVFVIKREEQVGLEKRGEKGLLSGLYGLPMTDGALTEAEAVEWIRAHGMEPAAIRKLKKEKHVFSHVEWHMRAYAADVHELKENGAAAEAEKEGIVSNLVFAARDELEGKYALPAAFKKWEIF